MVGTNISKVPSVIYNDIKNQLVHQIDEVAKDNVRYPQLALSERLANAGYLPMFGFPTKTRYLYEKVPKILPPEQAIDRNLDLAISEFAPGSEIVKDKRLLVPVGVVSYRPDGWRTPKEVDGRGVHPNGVDKCLNCETIFLQKAGAEACSVCQGPLRNMAACSPLGFCLDYQSPAKDFEGNFEWSPRAGDVTLDPTSELLNQCSIDNLTVRSNQVPKEGIVHQINDNNGALFRLGRIPDTHRWVVGQFLHYRPNLQDEENYAFISSRHTGVITLSIQEHQASIDFDPANLYQRSAFLSWAFLIRKSVCSHLDVETNEFDVGYRVAIYQGKEKQTPEVYIVERAENGAGYCNHLNGMEYPDISGEVFLESLLPDGDVYEEILMKNSHEQHCASSCYDCLRDYYNQKHHALLNWRVAMDLASLAKTSSARFNFSQPHWSRYLTETLLPGLEKKLNGRVNILEDNLITIQTSGQTCVIEHPFWSSSYITSIKDRLGQDIKMINIMDAMSKSRL